MGWLGMSEDQFLDTDMNTIAIAYEGKLEMLQACYGDGKPKGDPPPKKRKPSRKEILSVMRERKKK